MQSSVLPARSANAAQQIARYWDWYSVLIVILMVQVAAARLLVTGWTTDLAFAGTLGFFGVALGFALGYSQFGSAAIFSLSLLYTLSVVPLKLISTIQVEAFFVERLASLAGRLSNSIINLATRHPVEDPLFFIAFVSLVYWLAALAAGYFLTRHKNPAAVILPFGIITLIVQTYDDYIPGRAWALALYILLSLVLQGRLSFVNNLELWKERRVFAASDAAHDVQNLLWLAAGLAVLMAWLMPVSLSSLDTAAQSWDRISRPFFDRISPAVSALESPYGSGKNSEFYSEDLTLGRSAALGEMPIFSIRINSSLVDPPPRFYWRGRVYDTYSNGVWENHLASSQDFEPSQDKLKIPPLPGRVQTRLTVTVEIPRQALLYSPAEPYWVNRPGSLFFSPAPDQAQDLSAWLADPVLLAGDRYELHAEIANPSVEDLRLAGTDYPDWIRERYLQIPVEMENRLRDLAETISPSQASTPYDQAVAITDYLRREIEYSTELPPLPDVTDPLLWILFEYKKGFCMYDASAEVLLLRSLGVPARLAVGFAQGELEKGVYHVQREDSHAWPEVYFPDIGWVEFEPTVIQAPLARPLTSGNASLSRTDAGNLSNAGPEQPIDGQGAERAEQVLEAQGNLPVNFFSTLPGRLAVIAFTIFLSMVLIYLNRHYLIFDRLPVYLNRAYARYGTRPPRWLESWNRWSSLTSIEKSFQAINLSLAWVGNPAPRYATAAQRAAQLQKLLPAMQAEIELLAREHENALFTPRPTDAPRARRAAMMILIESLKTKLRMSRFRF